MRYHQVRQIRRQGIFVKNCTVCGFVLGVVLMGLVGITI